MHFVFVDIEKDFIFLSRWMSKDESLDRHLHHGTDYVNLPAHLFSGDTAPLYTRNEFFKSLTDG